MPGKQAELRSWQDWTDPDFFTVGRQSEQGLVRLFFRQILPRRAERTKLTLAGWMLIFVSMGIGSAAYNTASNILFLTLSLILSSLVLSGVLSLINFRRLDWTLHVPNRLQVDEPALAEVGVVNRKRIFPSMSLAFEVIHSEVSEPTTIYLPRAIGSGEQVKVDWQLMPRRRGPCMLQLQTVASKFPFGFILKKVGIDEAREVLVWPARIGYQWAPQGEGRRLSSGRSRHKVGVGSDLLKIRDYVPGDAPRLIHWKASARRQRLMVRQLAQEGEGGFHLFVDAEAGLWSEASFEQLCSLAATLAEDLYRQGRLESVQTSAGQRMPVPGMRQLHHFFDELAVLEPQTTARTLASAPANRITFRPLEEGAVAIYLDGTRVGQSES